MKTREEILAKIQEWEDLKVGSPPMNRVIIDQKIATLRWVLGEIEE